MEDKWERKVEATKLPKAIAIEIEIEGLGKIQRKFMLPLGAAAPKSLVMKTTKTKTPKTIKKTTVTKIITAMVPVTGKKIPAPVSQKMRMAHDKANSY